MVNHFASLLGNINLAKQQLVSVPFVLGDTNEDPDISVSSDGLELISLDEAFISLMYEKEDSKLINRSYAPIKLPQELLSFYNLIFPEVSSNYYKHFLLYTYLVLVNSTQMSSEILKYDSRVTYNLKEIQDYFRFYRTSLPVSSDKNYSLHTIGKLKPDEELNYYLNNFVIKQIGNTANVLIFSTTQGLYYKENVFPSPRADNMQTTLTIEQNTGVTKVIPIGITGLSFFISGPFNDPELGLLNHSDRIWSFTAEAPFIFDFEKTLKTLENYPNIVERMLSYRQDECDYNYQSIWQSHYNSLYRFVGLLLAYVNRVQLLWLQQTSQ